MMEMDDRDSAECQNWEKKGRRCHFGIVNEENDKRVNSAHLLPQIEEKNVKGRRGCSEVQIFISREREPLLSRFTGDRTVEILRAKKESCSTRKGLRVDSGFREFHQTSRGRRFILLGFCTLFKCYMMFRLV